MSQDQFAQGKVTESQCTGMRIVVRCPDCGEQRVAPSEVTVRSCVDTGAWSYRFTCPGCQGRTVASSEMNALMRAVEAGAAFEGWMLPTELLERPDGPPFTIVDVLDLHLLLLEPDWFDQISACDLDGQR